MTSLSSANALERKINTMDDKMNQLVQPNQNFDENEAKRQHTIELQSIQVRIEQEKFKKAVCMVENRKKAVEETEKPKTLAMKERKRYAEKLLSKRQQSKEDIEGMNTMSGMGFVCVCEFDGRDEWDRGRNGYYE